VYWFFLFDDILIYASEAMNARYEKID